MHDDICAGKWYTRIKPAMKVIFGGGFEGGSEFRALLRQCGAYLAVGLAGLFDRSSCAQFALVEVVPSP